MIQSQDDFPTSWHWRGPVLLADRLKLDIQHIVAASKQMELTMDLMDEDMHVTRFEIRPAMRPNDP